jgi:hypothetical protein
VAGFRVHGLCSDAGGGVATYWRRLLRILRNFGRRRSVWLPESYVSFPNFMDEDRKMFMWFCSVHVFKSMRQLFASALGGSRRFIQCNILLDVLFNPPIRRRSVFSVQIWSRTGFDSDLDRRLVKTSKVSVAKAAVGFLKFAGDGRTDHHQMERLASWASRYGSICASSPCLIGACTAGTWARRRVHPRAPHGVAEMRMRAGGPHGAADHALLLLAMTASEHLHFACLWLFSCRNPRPSW